MSATHMLAALQVWLPTYWIGAGATFAAAVIAAGAAGALWPLVPRLIALPSTRQLELRNFDLAARAEEDATAFEALRETERQLRWSKGQLERRASERTAELLKVNQSLTVALQKVAYAEEEFRVSFEGSTVGKTQAEADTGRLLRVNPAFAAMLGYAPVDMIGRPARDFTWPEDLATEDAEDARLRSREINGYAGEKRFLRRDGSYVWGRASVSVVRNRGEGRPDITVAVIENIEDQQKARAALRLTTGDLERTVAERTTALAQRDLLLREVYHRVKNNLQIVDALLLMQARDISDPAARAGLRALRSRVFALGLVHHQLMGSTNHQTLEIGTFLKELSNNLIAGGGSSGIGLDVRAPPLDVGLDIAIPLGLLVTELVTNALKHAFPGGVGLIEVVLDRADDGAIELKISDNGRGYDPAETGEDRGLGGRIVRGLLSQIHGDMTILNDSGTHCQIIVPHAQALAA